MQPVIQFKIVGIFTSTEYQKCKSYAKSLAFRHPEKFLPPILRPMLDVQWNEFIIKCKRKFGGKLWELNRCVAVFQNGFFFGTDKEFIKLCARSCNIHIFKNFARKGEKCLRQMIENSEREYVYFSFSIDGSVIGTIIIELYTDLVPITCANFLRLCKKKKKGYKQTSIHRVVKTSWIQIGGWDIKKHRMPCENYFVPHDRRGVVSMCHKEKHVDNNTQFIISLDPTPWMDYYFVAFGQVLHGDHVLSEIESVATNYESPETPIVVEDCGEYKMVKEPPKKLRKQYDQFVSNIREEIEIKPEEFSLIEPENIEVCEKYPKDIIDHRDRTSYCSLLNRRPRFYCF